MGLHFSFTSKLSGGHDTKKKSKVTTTLLSILLVTLLLSGCTGMSENQDTTTQRTTLKVLHAGSLAVPLEELEKAYEAEYPNVDVQREAAGSVKTIQKVTELHKESDVVASADYALIPKMMMPEYTDWYAAFAKNQIVLAYRTDSKYADEITKDNWPDVLRKPDVKFGFSNGNDDPCGYRSLMTIQLAEMAFEDDQIFDDLVAANSAIPAPEADSNGTYRVIMPKSEDMAPNADRLMIRSMEVELIHALESKDIDYYFIYRSVAKQHEQEILDLDESVDLSSVTYVDTYNKAQVLLANGNTMTGAPIVYGVTIPNNAPNRDYAVKFVEAMIDRGGQQIFIDQGQPPIVPAITNDKDKVPAGLQQYVTEE